LETAVVNLGTQTKTFIKKPKENQQPGLKRKKKK